MIQSMTGYGKHVVTYKGKKINIEIKSLNSKSLDISTRIAPIYREKELEVRQLIQHKLQRGKVDFSLWVEKEAAEEGVSINVAVAEKYCQQMRMLSERCGIPLPQDWFATLMRLPDVTGKPDTEELDEEEWEEVRGGINQAVDDLVAFRTQEGKALEKKFLEKADNIEKLMTSIEQYERQRVEKIRNRIVEGLKAIPDVEYDSNRLEQELIYYIEKLDISEEKQRLANHLSYFRATIGEAPGQGKKLGFIAQEMGREINTTGSKSNNAEMQNIVVKMKDELEQIKEQVLNAL